MTHSVPSASGWPILLWIIALPVMLIGIGRPEVTRTQEARVLEVGRQMLGRPVMDWIIPKLNGDLRLQKPPLPYWMSAAAFSIGGVSEGVGRIPTAILGWLTLGVVYCAARWLFGARCGLISAACLLGSYYFARHTRLAETDVPATLFVTLAIYALWRGSDANKGDASLYLKARVPFTWVAWMHLGAFAIGMSIVCKGGPGAFPILFLVLYALVERNIVPIRRFLASGALVTLALVAAPWFVYAGNHRGWHTFISELRTMESGADHGAPVYQYIPWLIVGTLPWTPVVIVALVIACREWKRDARLRGLLVWLAAIALPLCVTGNKQSHYLIPLMPVLMIFAGWMIDRWNNRALIGAAIVCGIALPPIVMLVIPRFAPEHTREMAAFVRERFDDQPLCFYGPNASIPLCFNLRRAIPTADDPPELARFLARDPRTIVITIGKDKRPVTAPNADQFQLLDTKKVEDQVWDFYRVVR